MSDFLNSMAASSRARADALPARWDSASLDKPVYPLRLTGFDLIAEIKDNSPAEGRLAAADANRTTRAAAYVQGGAAAISVLTEPDRFAGELAHVEDVVAAVSDQQIPVMRKDFLTDVRQVLEARSAGASGVLLIAAILDDKSLDAMLRSALEHSMFVLLEAFDAEDLERCSGLVSGAFRSAANDGQLLVGVNTRNLRTLEVDSARLERLSGDLPAGAIAVAESGLKEAADAARVAQLGYRMGLIGTALMRSSDPATLVTDMLVAGRQVVSA